MPEIAEETLQRLREAGGDELRVLVRSLVEDLDARAAQLVLRNPHAGEEVIRTLAEQQRLLVFYDFKRELAMHPATPQVVALTVVAGLFWRDLVAVGANVRVRPVVRRSAEQRLIERLPGLAVGERVAVARTASPHVLQVIRHDPTPRVIGAMLDNPRLVEGDLLPLASADTTHTPVLAVILGHRKWGYRYPVRVAVVRNPRAPLALAMQQLPMLKKPDLKAVASDPRLAAPLRRRAELLTGG
jgi:hypothetical protein